MKHKLLTVQETQGIKPGMVVETSFGLGRVANVYRDEKGIVGSVTAKLCETSQEGFDWMSADLDLATTLKFHTVH